MDKYTKKSSVFHSPAYFLHNLSHIASPRLPALDSTACFLLIFPFRNGGSILILFHGLRLLPLAKDFFKNSGSFV